VNLEKHRFCKNCRITANRDYSDGMGTRVVA
jgi:hypothetical protein